jgi:hypothetical protein
MNNKDLKIKTTWKQNNMKWSCHMFSVFFFCFSAMLTRSNLPFIFLLLLIHKKAWSIKLNMGDISLIGIVFANT